MASPVTSTTALLWLLSQAVAILSYGDFDYNGYRNSPSDNPLRWNISPQAATSHYYQQQPQYEQNYPNQKRYLSKQQIELMSHQSSDFSSDPGQILSPQPPSEPLDGWTSTLINTLFGGNNNNNNNNDNNYNNSGNIDNITDQMDSLNGHIRRILVPRVAGTQGNVNVRQYIVNVLRANDYQVELDEFTGSTPIGNVKFANIIATSNPRACRQLVFACHYDSKMMDGFLGATDSAVPCAMLLKLGETFNKSFRSDDDVGLRFIFFDGEEAFVQWTSQDSLYGSRHLAEKWEKQPAPRHCKRSVSGSNDKYRNELSRIELFVLLDLIGASDSSFVSYNRRVKDHYNAMQTYEKQYLTSRGLSNSQVRRETAFKNRAVPLDMMEDDHVPFKQRGVPILSLLSNPFPRVWHTIDDNYNAIDFPRTRQIQYVLEQFVENYGRRDD